jgi:glutathione S-transferase
MKLVYAPNTCALGIHLLLEEIGLAYAPVAVDFTRREQYGPEFVALNPKSKVPVLVRDDGSVLTELPAIAFYLARLNPSLGLLPVGLEGEIRALELLEYLVGTVHMRGYTRLIRPNFFTANAADEPAVRAAGHEVVTKAFALLAPILGDQHFMLGRFGIVDCVMFFLEYWARHRCEVPLPANLDAHFDRLMARPAAQRTLAAEGLA